MWRSNSIKLMIAAAMLCPVATRAQTYPSRPIVMVVPYAAGGTFDVMGRIIAVRMSEILGQQVVVENTTGAGGIIGVNRVVNAAPDGYTILLGSTGTHVPYRGSAPASNDLIGGQIDYLCGNLGAAAPLIVGKQVKAIAVLSRARSPLMPDLASAHEQGLTGMDVTTWTAIFLPKGAPRAIVDKLNEVTHATMETPVIKSRMLEIGVTGVAPDRRSPEYLAKFVEDEVARWEGPIKSGGLQVD